MHLMPLLRITYTLTFVMDGNFGAVHQKQEIAHHHIKLSDGDFFMTEPNHYKAHLAVATEMREVNISTPWSQLC
jgi:hypothetical protein